MPALAGQSSRSCSLDSRLRPSTRDFRRSAMKQSMRIAAAIVILAMGPCVGTGQMASPAAYEGGDDNPRANVNVGGPLVLPLNPTARAVNLGFGVIVGSGYNFS